MNYMIGGPKVVTLTGLIYLPILRPEKARSNNMGVGIPILSMRTLKIDSMVIFDFY
jgi:hypothetical protein